MLTKFTKISQKIAFSFSTTPNYFKLFNLPHNFSQQQLKSSYLSLVKKHHPDLTDDPRSAQLFKIIQQGYQILSDQEKRNKHELEHKMPGDSEQSDVYDQMVDKYYKSYKRKDQVNDQWNFSYKLFKQHYQKVEKPKGDFQRYEGQGYDEYYARKDQKGEKIWKPVAGGVAAFGILAAAYFYTNA